MVSNAAAKDVFDLDIQEVKDPNSEAETGYGPMSDGIPTLCSNQCTGDCCTISGC